MIKKAPAGTATQIADERQSQLKLLIARGKEQGYLTYAEVNDHLPSEIVDPEQIEDIVNMINDMGIPVYEKAPDAESLLLTDATAAPDEEAVEEATAASHALTSEADTLSRLISRFELGAAAKQQPAAAHAPQPQHRPVTALKTTGHRSGGAALAPAEDSWDEF